MTANGEVQTKEEAQVYVHDLGLFVTVQLLEETPAVLPRSIAGKALLRTRMFIRMENSETPRLTQHGKTITCYIYIYIILYLSLYQDYHHLPATRLLHQDQRISQNLVVNPKHQQIQ